MKKRIKRNLLMGALGITLIPTSIVVGVATLSPFGAAGTFTGGLAALAAVDSKLKKRVFTDAIEQLRASVIKRDELAERLIKNPKLSETLRPKIDKLTQEQIKHGKELNKIMRHPDYRKNLKSLDSKERKEIEKMVENAMKGLLTTDIPT